MTAPDNPNGPGSSDPMDWDRYESELGAAPQPGQAATPAQETPAAGPPEPAATDATVAGDGRVLVDSLKAQRPPHPGLSGLRAAQRRPIVPAWLRSRAELGEVCRWAAGFVAHTSGYHLARVPKYAGKLVARAPRGAARVSGGWLRWLLDTEGEPVRQATVRAQDAEAYLKLARQRDRRVRWRATLSCLLLAILVMAGVALLLAPPAVRWASLALLVAVLGVAGTPADRPLLDTAVVIPKAPRLTSEMVVRALGVLGLAGINQALGRNPKAVGFPAPITRDGGRGWRADVDLPPGVTAAEVIDRRDKLASGLGRPLGCVWPEPNHQVSPGRLMLYVADQDMASARQPAWPLAKGSQPVDLFHPFPFGTDPRGRTVPLELVFTNLLIGSIPRQGKTFSLRLPLLAAALDPRTELWTFELKGTGDLEPLAQVSARYASGNDDDVIAQVLAALRDLRKQCGTRAATIKGLPKTACPENKVTPQLAARPQLGLHLLVMAVDECQELFTHPEHGTEAGELAEKIIKLGPALGIILILATQRPDARSLPTGVSANVGTRFCLRVMGQTENDMVLGTSAYKNGVRATMFTNRDKGIGYLVGAADDAQITRTFYLDNLAAERICARARALREQAGTLRGHAAGQAPSPLRDTLLDDVLTVVPAAEAKVWSETILERLAALRPQTYGTWTRDQLTAALRAHGITTDHQVWGPTSDGQGANRRGIHRAHVAAAAKRTRRPSDPEADQ